MIKDSCEKATNPILSVSSVLADCPMFEVPHQKLSFLGNLCGRPIGKRQLR